MAWELFNDWSDLQFVNYSVSEQFEDGTVGAWRMEDWEIYGPGAGGYTSSGPYGDWQSDVLSWLNNGSILANELINWDASQFQSHNLSAATQEAARTAHTTYYLNGTSYLPQDATPTFGAAGSGAKYQPGDIVVTGARTNGDQSTSYRFASYDPTTQQQVSWVENISFLDMYRTNADAGIMRFELADAEPALTSDEAAALEVIRTGVNEILADLHTLGPDAYFDVEGWGRVRVSELISLIVLSDWTIHPQTLWHPTPPGPSDPTTVGDITRNGGNPEVRLNRSNLLLLAQTPSLLYFHILHEFSHATRRGWDHRSDSNIEGRTNDLASKILETVGRPDHPHGSASTAISFHSGLPEI